MLRSNKEIKKDIDAIAKMVDSRDRLGFAISEAVSTDYYREIVKSVLSLARQYPDQLDMIEATTIAICGYGFNSLREQIKEQKEEFDSL